MKVLSIVCARAGSRGLKNKCLKTINGKKIIEYAIEYSLSLGRDVKTVVSTDIREVVNYCREKEVEYIDRDPAICMDESRIEDALADAIEKKGSGCDCGSLVYGNIPTRYPELFQKAMDFLNSHAGYDAVLSMQNVEKFHPEWMLDLNGDILPKVKEVSCRRQGLSQKMIHDGHTILFRTDAFYGRYKGVVSYDKDYMYSIFGSIIKPLLNNEVIIDIDTAKDLKLAEAIMRMRNSKA